MNRLCTGVCVIMLVTFSACRENSPSVEETGTREAFKSVVKHNADWVPIEQEFNGVTMVLVPMGCFDMGNDPYIGNVDIHKGGRQCFDTPFWIDQTEVTNRQYGSAGRFSGDNRPRDSVTWVEARDFCAHRDAHLPTEAEWEYAARGPDDLIYPWGNNGDGRNVVQNNQGTADVGSIPAGRSWVGALDMSGNVAEWVSSLSAAYPYDASHESDTDTQRPRVIRGGAWYNLRPSDFRATYRGVGDPVIHPDMMFDLLGFRCARSYN